jgi:hypothetical protein
MLRNSSIQREELEEGKRSGGLRWWCREEFEWVELSFNTILLFVRYGTELSHNLADA